MSKLHTEPTLILAKFLHGGHIDATIRFKVDDEPRQMLVQIAPGITINEAWKKFVEENEAP